MNRLGPIGAGAGAPAPPAYTTMFQINRGFGGVDPKMKALLHSYANSQLLNCANLSLIYLGFVRDPARYLNACVMRKDGTVFGEVSETIEEAFKQIDRVIPPLFSIILPVDPGHTYGQRMAYLAEELLPGYATLVGVEFADGTKHMAVLEKRLFSKTGTLLDFQLKNPDGSYPAVQPIAPDGSTLSPYLVGAVTKVFKIMGPVISDLALIKSLPLTLVGSLYMNTNTLGGRRRRQKSRRRKTSKKGNKSRATSR